MLDPLRPEEAVPVSEAVTGPAMLDGKVVILIGGLGLIGRGVAVGLAKAGARTLVASRGATRPGAMAPFDALAAEIRARLEPVAVDIADPASVEAMMAEVAARCGRVDVVVNCAYPPQEGFGTRFEDVDYQVFCGNVTRHLGSFFLVAQKACGVFAAQGFGTLIMFSSIYGVMAPRFELYDGTPMTKEVEYIIAKSAIVHLTAYLAKYYKGKGVRVNCISPGGVLNGQHPDFLDRYNAHCSTKGMMDPEDLAGTVVFLASESSACVNGQNIVVDDGFSL